MIAKLISSVCRLTLFPETGPSCFENCKSYMVQWYVEAIYQSNCRSQCKARGLPAKDAEVYRSSVEEVLQSWLRLFSFHIV